MDTPINPIDERIPVIAKAVQDWKNRNTPQDIEEHVQKSLTSKTEEVIMKLLGFKNDWGRWEIVFKDDAGNSARDYFTQQHQLAIQKWLTAMALPKLSIATTKSIMQSYKEQYEYKLRKEVSKLVEIQVSKDIQAIIEQVTRSKTIDAYVQAVNLITSKDAHNE